MRIEYPYANKDFTSIIYDKEYKNKNKIRKNIFLFWKEKELSQNQTWHDMFKPWCKIKTMNILRIQRPWDK